jgi:N-acetylmuramoyl-L-alanine amidase
MPLRLPERITDLVIHCTASPNGKPYTLRQIDRDHRLRGFRRDAAAIKADPRGLTSIGYHRVCQPDGTVEQGRAFEEWGAHAPRPTEAELEQLDEEARVYRGNPRSIGWCLVGTDRFTPAQWETLRADVVDILERFQSIKRLWSHHELTPVKRCPCFSVREWLLGGMAPIEANLL